MADAEGQLRTLRSELALVSRQTTMGAMTASIAHEVNQPLAAIVMNAKAAVAQ
jgi:C4-dicarboxylate-specific signal transduction histidine kinase